MAAPDLDKPYLAVRVKDESGTLKLVGLDGACHGIEIGKPYFARRVKDVSGTLYFLVSDQKLHDDGSLIRNKPYFARRVKEASGKLYFLAGGKVCGDSPTGTFVDCHTCTRPDTINLEVTQGGSTVYLGTMTYGVWIYKQCDCFTCNGGEDDFTTCEESAFCAAGPALDPYFDHYFHTPDTSDCYGCYATPMEGYVSDDYVPIDIPGVGVRQARLIMECYWTMRWWWLDNESSNIDGEFNNDCSLQMYTTDGVSVLEAYDTPAPACDPIDWSYQRYGPSGVDGDVVSHVWE
jgi:hypothetical protein